jgi:hypothetical protein
MWFKKKPGLKPSFSIGTYALDMALIEEPPLREFSAAEYEVMARRFEGERIYHAPEVEFIGRPWNLNLGVVQGKLWKIALFLEMGDGNEANVAALVALAFCGAELGKPAKQRTGLYVWDTSDGNVILQTAEVYGSFAVNLFLTSNCLREFQPLR